MESLLQNDITDTLTIQPAEMSEEWQTSTRASAWKPHLLSRVLSVEKLPEAAKSPHIVKMAKITMASDPNFHGLDIWWYNSQRAVPTRAQQFSILPPFIERLVFPNSDGRDAAFEELNTLRLQTGYKRVK
jgi:hypothetical protein